MRAGGEAALLALEEVEALFGLQRYPEALGVATRALRRRSSDPDLEARLRIERGHAHWLTGRVRSGISEVRRASERAVTSLAQARAHEVLGLFAWKEQELDEASRHLADARRLYAECEHRGGLVSTLEKEGAVLRDAGRLREALRLQTQRVEIASTTTRLDALALARNDRGGLLTVMGRWAEARAELDLAADLFQRVSDPREFTLAGVNRAAVDLATGDVAAARAALGRALDIHGPPDRRNPRSQAEALLVLSDAHLAAGEPDASERAAAEALLLFGLVGDRVGQCRGRFRRSHALLGLGHPVEAIREARRALRLAPPARTDLRGLAELALGRALLRARGPGAVAAFERALSLSEERPAIAEAARLGRALARGADVDDGEVRAPIAALESWGDRRLLSYCLAEVREQLGATPATRPGSATAPSGVPRALCARAQAVVEAAVALAGEGDTPARWAAAMRAIRPLLPWWRAALVSEDGWELGQDGNGPVRLPQDHLSRELAGGVSAPVVVDLLEDPLLCGNPGRVLHGLSAAVLAPVCPGTVLYVDVREGRPVPGGPEAALLGQLAQLMSLHAATVASDAGPAPRFPEIVGRCAAMEALFRQMEQVAPTDISVHVFGETGTGKEAVARALHGRSRRSRAALVAINASTLTDELFEAEMFGHTRGAFTGAVTERKGHVAEAEGGTLFIDEVTDLSPRAQAKVLRLLQEKEYRRLGETETRRADIRIVTASNTELQHRVAAGLLREDLMYRLNAMVLALPPLRARGDDILRLARHFLARSAAREGKATPALPPEVVQAVTRHTWPGNVRELESEMTRLVVLAGKGPLRVEHLSARVPEVPVASATGLRDARTAFERDHISRVLGNHGGNRSRTACALGVTRQALVAKIRRLGI